MKIFLSTLVLLGLCAAIASEAHADLAIPAGAVGQISCTLDAAVSSYAKAYHNGFIEHLGPSAGPYGYPLEGYFRADGQGGRLEFSGGPGIQAVAEYSGTPGNARVRLVISKRAADGSTVFSQEKVDAGVASQGASFRLPADEVLQDDANFLRRVTSLELNCTTLSYTSTVAPTVQLDGQITSGVMAARAPGAAAPTPTSSAAQSASALQPAAPAVSDTH